MRFLFASFVVLISPLALANEGFIEVNHACASGPGCFAGDAPGYPVTINQAGNYRLTSNLVIPNADTHGVSVEADNVSLNLARFEIRGPATCSGTPVVCTPTGSGNGVMGTSYAGTHVSNGRVIGAGGNGIKLGLHATVEDVHANGNGLVGISTGSFGLIQNSLAYENGGDGISGAHSVIVVGNATAHNAGDGIECIASCNATRNTALQNAGDGIALGADSLSQGNTVYANKLNGIAAANGSSIIDNAVSENGDDSSPASYAGIRCVFGCAARGNTIRSNKGFGLSLGTGSTFRENVITSNGLGPITGTGSTRGDNFCSGTGTVSEFCP